MPSPPPAASCHEQRQWQLLLEAAVVHPDQKVTQFRCPRSLWHLDLDCSHLDELGAPTAEQTVTVAELIATLGGRRAALTLCACFSELEYATTIPDTVTGDAIAAVAWLLRPHPDTSQSLHLTVGGLRAELGAVPASANSTLDTQVRARAAALLTEHDTLAGSPGYRASVAAWLRTLHPATNPRQGATRSEALAEYDQLTADTVWLRTLPYVHHSLAGAAVDFDPATPTLLRVPRLILDDGPEYRYTRLLTRDGTMPRSAVAAAVAVAGYGTEPLDALVAAMAASEC